jgi:PIN domain nuclease of toxin-antitoxin system
LRLLLDTATFIWAIKSPDQISPRALNAILDDGAVRELSALSISEIAIKHMKGKLDVRREDIVEGLADLRMQVLPWNSRHALRLFDLPPHHGDPFDRQIIAQAAAENIPVVTSDAKFRLYSGIEVIW